MSIREVEKINRCLKALIFLTSPIKQYKVAQATQYMVSICPIQILNTNNAQKNNYAMPAKDFQKVRTNVKQLATKSTSMTAAHQNQDTKFPRHTLQHLLLTRQQLHPIKQLITTDGDMHLVLPQSCFPFLHHIITTFIIEFSFSTFQFSAHC